MIYSLTSRSSHPFCHSSLSFLSSSRRIFPYSYKFPLSILLLGLPLFLILFDVGSNIHFRISPHSFALHIHTTLAVFFSMLPVNIFYTFILCFISSFETLSIIVFAQHLLQLLISTTFLLRFTFNSIVIFRSFP